MDRDQPSQILKDKYRVLVIERVFLLTYTQNRMERPEIGLSTYGFFKESTYGFENFLYYMSAFYFVNFHSFLYYFLLSLGLIFPPPIEIYTQIVDFQPFFFYNICMTISFFHYNSSCSPQVLIFYIFIIIQLKIVSTFPWTYGLFKKSITKFPDIWGISQLSFCILISQWQEDILQIISNIYGIQFCIKVVLQIIGEQMDIQNK